MLRIIVLASLLALFLQVSFAQSSSITWGPEYEKENGIIELVGSDDNNFYALSGIYPKPVLLVFNQACKLVSEKPINLASTGTKEIKYFDVIHTAGHDYIVFLDRDKKQNKSAFYYAEVKNGTVTPLSKVFHSFPFTYTYGSGLGPAVAYDEAAVSGSFRVSPDKKTIVTFGSDIGHSADQIIEVVVFNEALEQTWKKSHSIPVPNRQLEVLKLTVNNSGEVFVLTQQWEKLNDRYMGDKPLNYTVYAFTSNGVKEHKLKLDQNRQPVQLSLSNGPNGEVVVMGTYRTLDTKEGYALGTFFAKLDPSGSLNAKTFPFTANVLSKLNHTATETKNNALNVVSIKHQGFLPNGSFYFTAEKYTYFSVGNSGSTSSLTIGQMLVSFTPDGQSSKVDYLLQPLHLKNVYGPSNFYAYQKDNGVVFISDYVKLAIDDKGFNKAPIYTSVCYLEPGGQGKCEDIYNNPDTENPIYPSDHLVLKDGRHIVLRAKGTYGETFSFGIYK